MFATIAGPYPGSSTASDALAGALADQLDAGLGMVGDGTVREVITDADVAGVVEAWCRADEIERQLATERGVEAPPVKACVVGPCSSAQGVTDPRERREAALERAERLGTAIRALTRAGANVVQVDESAGLLGLGATGDVDGERAAALEAWTGMLDGIDVHVTLAVLGGSPDVAGPELLFAAPFASYLFDLIAGPDAWRLAAKAPPDRGLIVGVADARTDAPDTGTVMVYGARYAASLGGRGPGRVGLCPSVGLEGRTPEVARAKLAALAAAAATAELRGEALARAVDPRAVDARSAALGAFAPRRARGSRG